MQFKDIPGTLLDYFRVGLAGPRLKNTAGAVAIRNSGDTADAALTALQVNVSGDQVIINSDAVSSGTDFSYTLKRPATGMSAAVSLTLPTSPGTAGQALTTDGAGNTAWVSAGNTAACRTVDVATLAYGDTSPKTMFTLPANAVVHEVEAVVDTAFNGTPSVSVGVAGTVSKYLSATYVDLTATAGTSFAVEPTLPPDASSEAIIITYAAGGASAGAARIMLTFSVPS